MCGGQRRAACDPRHRSTRMLQGAWQHHRNHRKSDFRPRTDPRSNGIRAQPVSAVSLSITGFYHRYDDLRTIWAPGPDRASQLLLGNKPQGYTPRHRGWANRAAAVLVDAFGRTQRLLTRRSTSTRRNRAFCRHGAEQLRSQTPIQTAVEHELGGPSRFDGEFSRGRRLRARRPALCRTRRRLAWKVSAT